MNPVVAASTTEALTNGVSSFMTIVTTMLSTITSDAILMTAFSASFVFVALRVVRKLKRQ